MLRIILRPREAGASRGKIGLPSWSWASVGGDWMANGLYMWDDTKVEETAKILNVQTDHNEEDQPSGYTTGGFVILTPPFRTYQNLDNP